jgi:ATP adenylyltransferase
LNRIWAPWRIGYIEQKKKRGCIFCSVYREKKDKKNFIIFRSFHSFVMLNTFPYNNGHLMVISNRHVSSLELLKESEILDMNRSVIKAISVLKKVLRPQGFNIGINIGKFAGAGVEKHIHIHIVPRWIGDTNFMPVLSNTKVIPQSLKDLYQKLEKCLQEKK